MNKLKQKWNGILYEGGYDDFTVNTDMTKNNPDIERKKRAGYAYLLATNPETFELMVNNNVNLFHGTNSDALPNILKYGMNSVDELTKKGITVSTGEEWSRIGGKRNFISFSDDLDTASDYATLHSSKENSEEASFSVVLGISSNDAKHMKSFRVPSDLPEIGIMNNVPLEYIKFIAVPKSKVEFVRKLVNDERIIVTSMDMEEKFFYIDPSLSEMFINSEKAQKLIERKNQSKTEKTFDSKDVQKLAKERKFSGIQGIYRKIKELIKSRGKVNEQDSRNK
jgi:hypothetical protein